MWGFFLTWLKSDRSYGMHISLQAARHLLSNRWLALAYGVAVVVKLAMSRDVNVPRRRC